MIVLDNESVDLPTPTGPMRSFIFRPSQPGRYPGLILYSEIFQVTGPIRRIAAMLAGHGMIVVVPEVYHEFLEPGTVLGYTADGAQKGNDLKVAKEVSAYDDDVKACVKYLKESPNCTGNIGAAGLCLGGCLAYRAALQPEIQATACWYATDIHKRSLGKGQNDDTLARTGDIKGSMLMIWGRQDPHVDGEHRHQWLPTTAVMMTTDMRRPVDSTTSIR